MFVALGLPELHFLSKLSHFLTQPSLRNDSTSACKEMTQEGSPQKVGGTSAGHCRSTARAERFCRFLLDPAGTRRTEFSRMKESVPQRIIASAAMPRILPMRPSMNQGQFAPSERGGRAGKPKVYLCGYVTYCMETRCVHRRCRRARPRGFASGLSRQLDDFRQPPPDFVQSALVLNFTILPIGHIEHVDHLIQERADLRPSD